MSTLTSALDFALSGLTTSASRSALASRNVTYAQNEDYTRKSAEVISLPGGGATLSAIARSIDQQLLEKVMNSGSVDASRQTVLDALTRLSATIGEAGSESSLSGTLATLQERLKDYEADPSNHAFGATVATAAASVADKLSSIAMEISSVRSDADRGMAESVDHINALLDQFKIVNDAIVRGNGSSSTLADNLDQRDSILKLLSSEVGIRTSTRSNNDMSIFTDSGVVLFQGNARVASFDHASGLSAGISSSAVLVDGVAIAGPGAVMPAHEGRLAALVAVRDSLAPALEKQMDAIASGLVRRFAESPSDPSSSLPIRIGLFVGGSGDLVPSEGEILTGLAQRIAINPAADPDRGGDPQLIRDGGMSGSDYVYNDVGYASYQDRLQRLAVALDEVVVIDPSMGFGSDGNIRSIASQSAGWIESRKQSAQSDAESASAAHTRALESLLRVTGVSIDEEMASLLDLERAYQASSKIISVVNAMLANLLEAVG